MKTPEEIAKSVLAEPTIGTCLPSCIAAIHEDRKGIREWAEGDSIHQNQLTTDWAKGYSQALRDLIAALGKERGMKRMGGPQITITLTPDMRFPDPGMADLHVEVLTGKAVVTLRECWAHGWLTSDFDAIWRVAGEKLKAEIAKADPVNS